jgi:hypothetical protein
VLRTFGSTGFLQGKNRLIGDFWGFYAQSTTNSLELRRGFRRFPVSFACRPLNRNAAAKPQTPGMADSLIDQNFSFR